MTPESRDKIVQILELTIKNLRELTPEQLAPLSIRVELKRKIPKHKRPLWIEQKALQIFRAEKSSGKSNADATKAVNTALVNLLKPKAVRHGEIVIVSDDTFTTRALVALNDRDRNGERRKARDRLKLTTR